MKKEIKLELKSSLWPRTMLHKYVGEKAAAFAVRNFLTMKENPAFINNSNHIK